MRKTKNISKGSTLIRKKISEWSKSGQKEFFLGAMKIKGGSNPLPRTK